MHACTRSFPIVSLHIVLAALGSLTGCGTDATTLSGQETLSSTLNQAPIAEAGDALVAMPGETVVLDGSGSYDPDGDELQVQWSQVAGEPVSLTDADTLTPQFIAPELDEGTSLMFLLEVSDGSSTAEDRVAVGVSPANEGILVAGLTPAPERNLACGFSVFVDEEFDRRDGQRPLYVTLEATIIGEGIPEGATFVWNVDGTEDAGPVETHASRLRVFTAAGLHTIALTLTAAGITTGCESVRDGGFQESVTVWPVVSGRIETEDGTGIPAVTVSANAGGSTGVTDDKGFFELQIPSGWSGVVTPQHTDYDFFPPQRKFARVIGDTAAVFSARTRGVPDVVVPTDTGSAGGSGGGGGAGGGDDPPSGIDNCPNDPNKTEIGVCGCGVADTDSDNDGVPDCNDGCPSDPNKTASGDCGCGVADTDSDNNGTADCLDPTAPNLVLDIPAPTATRLSPCPVFASLDFDASSTGDASTWDQCKITWNLSRVGGLAPWPAKYRYVTDPRPGLNGVQRDMAIEGRGFNMAWLLTEGEWTIQCTVTNPSLQIAAVSSAPIAIAANTRTKVYVNSVTGTDDTSPGRGESAGAPYATLGFAFDQYGSVDDMEYDLAGGHVEFTTTNRTGSTSPNAYIRWDGQGVRPLFRDGAGISKMFALSSENQVWEGISAQATDTASSIETFTFLGRFSALVDCDAKAALSGNLYGSFAIPDASGSGGMGGGVLLLHCTTAATQAYSLIFASGGANEYRDIMLAGCLFGPSSVQSVIRINAPTRNVNILWSTLANNGNKSTLRFANGSFMHAYGCKTSDGDNLLGPVLPSHSVRNIRFEANYVSGSATNPNIKFKDGVINVTACNNIVDHDSGLNKTLVWLPSPTLGAANLRVLCNTLLNNGLGPAFAAGASESIAGGRIEGNLHIIVSPLLRGSDRYYYEVGETAPVDLITHNVHTPLSNLPMQEKFAQLFYLAFADYPSNLSMWNQLSFVIDDIEVDTVVDGSFAPTPSTTVPTPFGVYDDYYGLPRSSVCTAGAVE